jgi:hypothetical protein
MEAAIGHDAPGPSRQNEHNDPRCKALLYKPLPKLLNEQRDYWISVSRVAQSRVDGDHIGIGSGWGTGIGTTSGSFSGTAGGTTSGSDPWNQLINGKYQQITDPKADRLSRVSGINNNQVIVGTGYNGGNPPTISHGLFIVNGQVKEI